MHSHVCMHTRLLSVPTSPWALCLFLLRLQTELVTVPTSHLTFVGCHDPLEGHCSPTCLPSHFSHVHAPRTLHAWVHDTIQCKHRHACLDLCTLPICTHPSAHSHVWTAVHPVLLDSCSPCGRVGPWPSRVLPPAAQDLVGGCSHRYQRVPVQPVCEWCMPEPGRLLRL